MVKIEKMKEAIERWGESFLERVFTQEERENISPGKMYYQRLAARFAAKEAIIKAVSSKYSLSFKEICILNQENGAPYCKLEKEIEVEILLSLTHLEEYALACAIAQKKKNNI